MIKCPHVCGEKLSRSGYARCVVQKSSVAPALDVCLWRREADEIASSSHHDRLSANVRVCNLQVCCDVDVHSRLDIRHQSDYRWRTGQSVSPTAESAMRGCEQLVSETVHTVSLPDL